MKIMITLNLCCQIGQEGCLDLPHGEPASVEAEDGDMLVRAPGLEPKSGVEEPFLLPKERSSQCLEDIRKGKKRYCKAATDFALRCETMTFTQFHLYH
jgi:hypothetical protein